MNRFRLLVTLLLMPLLTVSAQVTEAPEGATISSAQVSGLDLGKLSPGLQADIAALRGTPLVRENLRLLAARIEDEQPRFVAAVRAVRDPDGEVRVVFVVAHTRDSEANINARYVVESVETKGVPDGAISKQLRDEMQALVGRRLDAEADRLETRLKESLPDYDVDRSIKRGSQQGQIRLVFEMRRSESTRWLRFEPLKSKYLYHSAQGWGGYLDLPIGGGDFRVTPSIAIDNRDDLLEEYSGFGIRLETRKIGTERLGASLEWSTFDNKWQPQTLTAIDDLAPGIPAAYEQRTTFASQVTFAFTPHVAVSGGVSISELEPLSVPTDSPMANAAVGSIGYHQQFKQNMGATHDVDARFAVRAGTDALESDLVYERYLASGSYWYRWGKHTVLASGMGGTISGQAPLFERFSLGDSATLRGWNKYDIAPAGGDRMFHTSVEYRYGGLALFLDTGSVWDRDTDRKVRVATGFGFHSGPFFMTVGIPVNTDDLKAVFTIGLRFSGIGIQKH